MRSLRIVQGPVIIIVVPSCANYLSLCYGKFSNLEKYPGKLNILPSVGCDEFLLLSLNIVSQENNQPNCGLFLLALVDIFPISKNFQVS